MKGSTPKRLVVDEAHGLYNLALHLTNNTAMAEGLVLNVCRDVSARCHGRSGELGRIRLYRMMWLLWAGGTTPRVEADVLESPLAGLTEEQRAAIVLRWVEKFSSDEIALIMGRSRDVIIDLVCRAYHQLRAKAFADSERMYHRLAPGWRFRRTIKPGAVARLLLPIFLLIGLSRTAIAVAPAGDEILLPAGRASSPGRTPSYPGEGRPPPCRVASMVGPGDASEAGVSSTDTDCRSIARRRSCRDRSPDRRRNP